MSNTTPIKFECDEAVTRVRVSEREGRFNLLNPSEEEIRLEVIVHCGDTVCRVSELFSTEEPPYYGDSAEDAIAAIVDESKRAIYSSKRPELLGKAEWMLSRIDEIEAAYLRTQIATQQKRVEEATEKLRILESRLEDCLEHMEGGAS